MPDFSVYTPSFLYKINILEKEFSSQMKKFGVRRVRPSPETSYADLKYKNIYVSPQGVSDSMGWLRTVMKHELGHFEITKEPIRRKYISEIAMHAKTRNFSFVVRKINEIEDMVINSTKKLVPRIRKYIKDPQIPMWGGLSEDEKDTVYKFLRERDELKDDVSLEYFKEVVDEVFKTRTKYIIRDINRFLKFYWGGVAKYVKMFNEKSTRDYIGDGPCGLSETSAEPKWEIAEKIKRILHKLMEPVVRHIKEEGIVGKRVARRYYEKSLYDPTQKLKPFERKTQKRLTVQVPRVTIIMDASGSMRGDPEIASKTFAVPFVEVLGAEAIISRSDYFHRTRNPVEVASIITGNDEGFDKLPSRIGDKIDTDMLIVVSDMEISYDEADGLKRVIENSTAKRKYILCTLEHNLHEHPNIPGKRYFFDPENIESAINIAKELTRVRG